MEVAGRMVRSRSDEESRVSDWENVKHAMSGGESVDIRQRWVGCEPPGPIGSGIDFLATDSRWTLAEDGVWERTIYAWKLV